jgi:segregation and condensation protein A
VVPDADYRIKLPAFEGPLDLLLFLIRKSELDIYDIPIEAVTRQYIDVLHSMQQLDLEIAGEFFVMAASLMEIKSRMLLPKGHAAVADDADDDAMDPRWELVHQLLQYKKFKEAAGGLAALAQFEQDKLPRRVIEQAVSDEDRPLKPVDRIELWNAFNIVLRRLAEKLVVGEIRDEQVTVSDQMETLLQKLQTTKSFVFSDLFPERTTLRILVATFLAVLELTRLRKLNIRQDDAFTDIICTAAETAPASAAEAAAPAVVTATGGAMENPLETAAEGSTVLA